MASKKPWVSEDWASSVPDSPEDRLGWAPEALKGEKTREELTTDMRDSGKRFGKEPLGKITSLDQPELLESGGCSGYVCHGSFTSIRAGTHHCGRNRAVGEPHAHGEHAAFDGGGGGLAAHGDQRI